MCALWAHKLAASVETYGTASYTLERGGYYTHPASIELTIGVMDTHEGGAYGP